MMRNTKWSFLQQLAWALLLSLFFIAVYGYTFNCGDQEEHLPYVYRLINPSLYSHDYLVPLQTEQFNIRFYYAWLIYFPSLIFPVKYVVLTLYLLCLICINFCIGSVAMFYSRWRSAFIIAPFTGLILLNNFTTGGNSVFDPQLTGSCMATALGCIAVFSLARKKYFISGVFAGLASLFQVLIGLQLSFLLIIGVFFLSDYDKIKNALKALTSYLIFSAPMLIPVLIRQSQAIPYGEENLFYQILYKFRSAHHYLPQYFPLTDYIKTLAIWLLALFAAKAENGKLSKLFILFTAFVLTGALLYYFALTYFNVQAIGKLQWFKLCGWITLLSSIPLTAFLAGFPFKFKADNLLEALSKFTLPASVLIIVILFNSAFIPVNRLRSRYQLGNYQQSELSKMHQWISDSTAIDCMILPIPSDDAFLSEAKRSIPVGYKAIIHEPGFLLSWYITFKAVYGVSIDSSSKEQKVLDEAVTIYPKREDPDIHYNGKIDYRIFDKSITDSKLYGGKQLIHQEGKYLLVGFKNAE